MEQMSHGGTMSGKCLRMKGVALRIFRLTLQEINNRNICQSIDNCMTVFQRDLLLKGAIRKNELSGKIDIVGNLG